MSPATGSVGLADFLAGRTTRRQPEPTATPEPALPQVHRPAPAGDLHLMTPAADPLDLSGPPSARPTTPRAPAPVAPPGGDQVDLSPPSTVRPASRQVSEDLDLSSSDLDLFERAPRPGPLQAPVSADLAVSDPPVAPPSAARPESSDLDLFPEASRNRVPRTPAPPPRLEPVVRSVPRVPPGGRVILTPREPTVTLDRVQSGVGALTITAICSPAVGDLVLGAVHQLADGSSGVVSRTVGIPTAPPRSRRPVLEAGRGEFDQIRVDLRQSRSLRRFVVYAVSASESSLAWGGTLLLSTHGGSRVEIPLDLAQHDGPVVLSSVYVVDGEFVVRAELDPVRGLVRDVAQAYGFRAITWADARTPVL
ncbi:hypothetical protein F1C76_11905 [Geodermatophilaceae bacterium NBWT11]|nr:hypothetical protein F1C76_11905 [Geodermatophilaceae bacterium NBWT11]